MPFPDIDPVAISLGPLAIRWYSLAYITGLLGGLWYIYRLDKKYRPPLMVHPHWVEDKGKNLPALPEAGSDTEYIHIRWVREPLYETLLTYALLGVVLGGRLGYVVFYQPLHFLQNPHEILFLWEGGMSFHGGVLGVIFAIWLFARKYKKPFFGVIDLVACATPIGLGLGRLANFVNAELWGRPTDVPWGVVFCNERIAAMFGGVCRAGMVPRHPSQLYEAVLEGLVLFLLLAWFAWKKGKVEQRGWLSGLFLAGYGLSRFTVEFFREPDVQLGYFFGGITMGQLLSVPMIALGVYLMRRARVHMVEEHGKQAG